MMASIQSTPKPQLRTDQVTTGVVRQCSRSPIEETEQLVLLPTLTADGHSRLHNDLNTQFDSIELRINNAILELESIYNVIGYSSSEVDLKKLKFLQLSKIQSIILPTIYSERRVPLKTNANG